ncbi:MAG TPA: galactokinase [Acidimicrobiales bacterium]|jgi:galactokinase|nr:galactokinase [Acidimicrobiales bacterium]
MPTVQAFAPGRVNLIGDHTDYTGGFALPMAVEWGTTVVLERGGDRVELRSDQEDDPATVDLGVEDPRGVAPAWARYVAGVVAVVRPAQGGRGTVSTTLPVGAGLSSSAALEVSVALALGFGGTPHELALACQRAEHLASGVPSGVMDQLASAAGVAGHALLLDCRSLELTPVPLPPGVDVVVVHSGQARALAGSAYAERRAQCEAAEAVIGPLRDASEADVARIGDGLLRRRARHVVSENGRVVDFAGALQAGDLVEAGRLMLASHRSLTVDFEVSTPALDALVAELVGVPGVYGARLTGAGFGGCVVALADGASTARGWRLHPSAGATVSVIG